MPPGPLAAARPPAESKCLVIDVDERGRFVYAGAVRDEQWLRENLGREAKADLDPETGFSRVGARARLHKEARFGALRRLYKLLVSKDVQIWRLKLARLPEAEECKQEEKSKEDQPGAADHPSVPRPAAEKGDEKGAVTNDEVWIRIGVRQDSPANRPLPRIIIDQRAMADWTEANETLKKISKVPGLKNAAVILDVQDDALCEWALQALDTLQELGFRGINFKQ